jgi:hypothetical protein
VGRLNLTPSSNFFSDKYWGEGRTDTPELVVGSGGGCDLLHIYFHSVALKDGVRMAVTEVIVGMVASRSTELEHREPNTEVVP